MKIKYVVKIRNLFIIVKIFKLNDYLYIKYNLIFSHVATNVFSENLTPKHNLLKNNELS